MSAGAVVLLVILLPPICVAFYILFHELTDKS